MAATRALPVLVHPTDRAAYGRLCRLLTFGKDRGSKASCVLGWDDLVAHGEGPLAILVPDEADEGSAHQLRRLRQAFDDRAYVAPMLRRSSRRTGRSCSAQG